MLSLEAIRILPDAELHELIAQHCFDWRPIEHAEARDATGCTHQAPDKSLHTLPEYTASWELTMPLANQARITRRLLRDAVIGHQEWAYHCYDRTRMVGQAIRVALTADDYAHRRALCELALWRAMQDDGTEEKGKR